ncbi:MAG: helix-turn-helix domain-containing protein [Beggiatoa sp.]|nr:helix-turn-helix domain-containing protein [Beggiatoa sp.]
MHAVDIARALGVHANTVYADLRAFSHEGVACILHRMHGGAPRRITDGQTARLLSVAEQAPTDLGLPYGRWSLTKLQAFVIKHRIVKAISREALRRVLKKGAVVSPHRAETAQPRPPPRRYPGQDPNCLAALAHQRDSVVLRCQADYGESIQWSALHFGFPARA